ncbi:hypothetical protein BC567DRAFT_237324 [Phyllosticta citribraziliensis]
MGLRYNPSPVQEQLCFGMRSTGVSLSSLTCEASHTRIRSATLTILPLMATNNGVGKKDVPEMQSAAGLTPSSFFKRQW